MIIDTPGDNDKNIVDSTFCISAKYLLGLSHFCSTEQSYYSGEFNGILIEKKDGNIRLVASDGTILGLYDLRAENGDTIDWIDGASGEYTTTIPIIDFMVVVKEACKNKRMDKVRITLNGKVKMEYLGTIKECEALKVSDLAKYEQVFPKGDKLPIPGVALSISALAKINKALSILAGTIFFRLGFFSEDGPILITNGDENFKGLLMPCK